MKKTRNTDPGDCAHHIDHLSVRFNDLNEHLSGVARDMQSLEHFIDSLVQIYFSATSQRTNEIVRVLILIARSFCH